MGDGGGSPGIIALVPDNWQAIVTLRHQVLRRLARYHPVVWVEPAVNWREFVRPAGAHFLTGDRWSEPSPDLQVLATGCRHPLFYRPGWLGTATFASRLYAARKRLVARGADRIALYLWRDAFAPALDLVDHDFSCYHIDDEYRFSDQDLPNSPEEVQLLRRVDQVIVHTPALLAKKGGVNPRTVLIPNGVDFRAFSSPQLEPADLARIPHPRLGYVGVIKRQLDFGLLLRLATARPQWSFVLVGPTTNIEGKQELVAALRGKRNVHFLGSKPAEELPGYAQHLDVCLMCYVVNDYTKYIYPLKLHEYLAAGRPVVSSPIGITQDFGHVLRIAGDDAAWLAALEDALRDTDPDAPAGIARRAVARAYDWDLLVARIAALFAIDGAAARRQTA